MDYVKLNLFKIFPIIYTALGAAVKSSPLAGVQKNAVS